MNESVSTSLTRSERQSFFDKNKSLRKVTSEDATVWRRSLKDFGLSEAAIRTHCGNVKTMLGEAERGIGEWIERFYNLHRRHTTLGNVSPINDELAWQMRRQRT